MSITYLDRSQAECVTDYMDSEVDDLGETAIGLLKMKMILAWLMIGISWRKHVISCFGIMECSFSSEEFPEDSLDELGWS